jgi:hypothetical protein
MLGIAGVGELGEVKELLLIEGGHVLYKKVGLVW